MNHAETQDKDVRAPCAQAPQLHPAAKMGRLTEAIAVFCLFAILVCAFTSPLIGGLSHLLPPHWDPRLMAWDMASTARRLFSDPLLLFHGNDFYPYGTTKAFLEPLLVPALFNMPIFLLSGNPVLSYNITLLALWSLSGLTMYLCAREILGHRGGALLAAAIWTLSPYRTDYYLEFNMQMSFALPIVVLYWYRFLRTQRLRDAALTFLFLSIQSLSCWYYAIMVSLYAIVFSACYVLLKPRGWKVKKLLEVIPIIMLFCVVLLPFAWPYFQVRKELGMVGGSLAEANVYSADVLTYLESRPIRWYHFSPTYHHAETSIFPGFIALLFLASSCGYFFTREARLDGSKAARIPRLIAAGGLLFTLLNLALRVGISPDAARFLPMMRFFQASCWALGFCLLLFLLRGRSQSKSNAPERALLDKDILATFLFASFVMFLLSLGPSVHARRQVIGHGLYYSLYGIFFPLHAVRVAARFGSLVLFSVGILSGLGVKWLHSVVARRWRPIAILWCLPFLLAALEYSPNPLMYEEFDWNERPAVYDFIASDPEDFVVAEWPLGEREKDGDFLLWSIAHNKKVLGNPCRWVRMMLPRTEEIATALGGLTSPDTAAESMTELRGIYPTKYLIVHREVLAGRMWLPWERLLENLPEGLAFLRAYDNQDYLFEICPIVERGKEFSREFSFEYVLEHSVARFRLRDGSDSPGGHPMKIYFNDRLLCGDRLSGDWKKYEFKLPRPYRKVAPNMIRIVSVPEDGNKSEMEFDGFSLSRD